MEVVLGDPLIVAHWYGLQSMVTGLSSPSEVQFLDTIIHLRSLQVPDKPCCKKYALITGLTKANISSWSLLMTRYPGIERLERAQASYRQAFKNDDLAAMIRERPAVLQGLDEARARKQLLTQQSTQIGQYEQTLSDLSAEIDRESLAPFAGQQMRADL